MKARLAAVRAAIIAFWLGLPLGWRKAATDFWTYAAVGLVALQIPADADWKKVVAIIGFIVLNAARRSWLTNKDTVLGETVELVAQEGGFELSAAQVQQIAAHVADEIEKRATVLRA